MIIPRNYCPRTINLQATKEEPTGHVPLSLIALIILKDSRLTDFILYYKNYPEGHQITPDPAVVI